MQRKRPVRQFSRLDLLKPWVLNSEKIETVTEAKLWFAFVEQYGIFVNQDNSDEAVHVAAPKDKIYQVEVPDPQGGKPFFVSMKFSNDVNELVPVISAELMLDEDWLEFAKQQYDGFQRTRLNKNKAYWSSGKLVRLSSDVVFIDPMYLTPETAQVLRASFGPDHKELHAGEIFSVKDKDYVLVRSLGWYARKEGKPGHRYGVFGEFKGKGATASVQRVNGTLKDDDGQELSFKPREALSKSGKKRKPLVVKKQTRVEGQAWLVKHEHEALEAAEVKVKPLTVFTNDEGQMCSFLFVEEAKGIVLDAYLYDEDGQKKELDFYDAIAACEAMALAYVNKVSDPGVVHSDLKPDNMFIKPAGKKPLPKVTIVDYGFARIKTKLQPIYMGTPEYVAPEVFAEKPYDEKRDIYSLGILFAEILGEIDEKALGAALESNKRVHGIRHDQDNFTHYYRRAANKGGLAMRYMTLFAGLRNVYPQFKAEIEDFVLRMISIDPDQRPDGHEVYQFFKDLRQGLAVQRVAEPIVAPAETARTQQKNKKGKSLSPASSSESFADDEQSGSYSEDEDTAKSNAAAKIDDEDTIILVSEHDQSTAADATTDVGEYSPPTSEVKFLSLEEEQAQKELEFAKALFQRIAALDGKVRRWASIGGETVYVKIENDSGKISRLSRSAAEQDNESETYILPKGAARIIDSLSQFGSGKISFLQLLHDCMNHAGQSYFRNMTTLFGGQDPEVTQFYYDVFYNIRAQAESALGINIKLDIRSLRK